MSFNVKANQNLVMFFSFKWFIYIIPCKNRGLDTSAPTTSAPSAPFGKDTSAPRRDTSAPHENTLRPLAKDTSVPRMKHFGPLFFRPYHFGPLVKCSSKYQKLFIIFEQTIKRKSNAVKTSALVIFLFINE